MTVRDFTPAEVLQERVAKLERTVELLKIVLRSRTDPLYADWNAQAILNAMAELGMCE